VCAFADRAQARTWLVLDNAAQPVRSRVLVRDAISVAALCEVAEEVAGGGKLDELRGQLAELRQTERPEGIDEAEEAVAALAALLAERPRTATPEYLDAIGSATRRLERALGADTESPFAAALNAAVGSVEQLTRDVEANYRLALT
jgi:hypothetical protein